MQNNPMPNDLVIWLKKLEKEVKALQSRQTGTIYLDEQIVSIDPVTGVKTVFGDLSSEGENRFGVKEWINDVEPPPIPSEPIITSSPGLVSITWTGENIGLLPQAPDFNHVNVYGTSEGTTVQVGIIKSANEVAIFADGLPGSSWTFWLTSVDHNGNESMASPSGTATIPALLDDQGISDAISDVLTKADAAYSSATAAQTAANGKNKIWRSQTEPTGTGHLLGDIWYDTNDGNRIYQWDGAKWESARDEGVTVALDDAWEAHQIAVSAAQSATAAQETADGKNRILRQDSKPAMTGNNFGDTWYDTNDDNKVYIWNGSDWIGTRDLGIPKALGDAQTAFDTAFAAASSASTAQTTANGKNTTIYSTSQPATAGRVNGDIWYDTDDGYKMYFFNNGAWGAGLLGSSAIGTGAIGTTHLGPSAVTLGKIAAGAVDAAAIGASAVTAGKIAAGAVDTAQLSASVSNKLTEAWSDATQALADAASAASIGASARMSADGKNTVIYNASQPATAGRINGDMWYDTNDGYKMYFMQGTAWVPAELGTSAIAPNAITATQLGPSAITLGKIAAGAVNAGAIGASAIIAGKIAAGAVDTANLSNTVNTKLTEAWNDATQALADAASAASIGASAKTSADGKNTVIYTATQPATAGRINGDMWYDTDDGYKMYFLQGTAWVAAPLGANALGTDSVTATQLANNAVDTNAIAASAITAGKIAGGAVDAAQLTTAINTKLTTAFDDAKVALTNASAAATAASSAQATANGKNTVIYSTSQPATAGRINGDMWYDTDDGYKMYFFVGNAWTAAQLGPGAIAANAIGSTQLADGAVDAAAIGASAITAGKIAAGAVDAAQLATAINTKLNDAYTDAGNALTSAASATSAANLAQITALTAQASATRAIDEARTASGLAGTKGKVWIQDDAPATGATYEWAGFPYNSESIKKIEGVESERNLYPSPALSNSNSEYGWSKWNGSGGNLATDRDVPAPWAATGQARQFEWVTVTEAGKSSGDFGFKIRSVAAVVGFNQRFTLHFKIRVLQDSSLSRWSAYSSVGGSFATYAWGRDKTVNVPSGTVLNEWVTVALSEEADTASRLIGAPYEKVGGEKYEITDVFAYAGDYDPNRTFFYGGTPDDHQYDLWIDSNDGNKTYRWDSATDSWSLFEDARVTSAANTAASAQAKADEAFNSATSAATAAGSAIDLANGKNRVWYTDNAPAGTGHAVADVWYDTNDGNKIYRWVGTPTNAWTPTEFGPNALAADSVETRHVLAGSIVAASIAASAIVAGKLAANAVVAGTVAASAITAGKLAAGAVVAGSVAASAIVAGNIAANAVVAGTLAANSVSAGNITASAVTAGKLAAGAVVAGSVAASAITAGNIAANAVVAGTIGASAVTAGTIATGAITAGTVAANAITTGTIASGVVTATTIGASAIIAGKLAADAVVAGSIAASAVEAGNIKAGAVVAGTIATDAVTANTIAASAIVAGKLAAGAVVAGTINANAVTSTTIAASAITAGKIASDAVVAGSIAASAVQAGNIAAGAVVAGTVAAGAVTAGTIVAGVVDTAALAASAVVAGKLAAGAVVAGTIAASAVTAGTVAANAITAGSVAANAIQAGNIAASAVQAGNIAAGAVVAGTIAASAVTAGKLGADAVVAGSIAASAVEAGNIAANAVVAGTIAASAVTAGKLAANAVVAGTIAASAVTAGSVAAGAIVAGTLAADAVTAGTIATGVVNADAIAASAIVAGKIAAGAVVANTLAASAVTAGKIAANAVTAGTVVANTIGTTELAASAVTAGYIAAGAVVAGTVAASAITAGNIAANAVVAGNISASAVTAGKIAADAVVAGAIAASAVEAGNIKAGAVVAGTLGVSAVQAGNIAAQAITAGTLGVGAVTANTIAASAVQAGNLAADAVVAGTIAASAVTAGTIDTNAVTSTTIAASAVVAGKIAANAVVAGTVAASAITAGKLAANAVVAGTIAASAVTAGSLAANSVVAGAIAASAVQAGKIAANAVVAGTIAASAVTAGKVAANAIIGDNIVGSTITGNKVAANTITVNNLIVTSMDNYLENGSFDATPYNSGWTVSSVASTSDPASTHGSNGNAIYHTSTGGQLEIATSSNTYVETDQSYHMAAWFFVEAGTTAGSVELRFKEQNSNLIAGSTKNVVVGTGSDQITPGSWQRISMTIKIPPNVTHVRANLVLRSITSGKRVWVDDVSVTRAASSNLIVDGAITAQQIAVSAVNATHISTGAIVAGKISSNAFTGYMFYGGTFQGTTFTTGPNVSTAGGVQMATTGIAAWSPAGQQTFFLDSSTGTAHFTGNLLAGSSITGSVLKTVSTANRGIELNGLGANNFMKAFDANGVETFSVDGNTGQVYISGSLNSKSSANDSGIRIPNGSNGGRIYLDNTTPSANESPYLAGAGTRNALFIAGGAGGSSSPYVANMSLTNYNDGDDYDPVTSGDSSAAFKGIRIRSGRINLGREGTGKVLVDCFARLELESSGDAIRMIGKTGAYMASAGETTVEGRTSTNSSTVYAARLHDSGNGESIGIMRTTASMFRATMLATTTTTNAANLWTSSTGYIYRSTSALKYKLVVRDMPEEYEDRILSLRATTWYDKTQAENVALWHEKVSSGEDVIDENGNDVTNSPAVLRRVPGMIAEEVEAAGLEEFVTYGEDGQIEGLMYDRLGVALIPVVARQRDRINLLEDRLTDLENILKGM